MRSSANSIEQTGPQTPKLGWFDRVFPMLGRHRLEFLRSQAAMGDITRFRMGPRRVVFINHPDLVRDVLVVNAHKFEKGPVLKRARSLLGDGLLTSEGSFHLRQRRMMQPVFHRSRIAGYADTMSALAEETALKWQPGSVTDIDREMMLLTLRIVGRTLFSADVDDDADDVGRSLTEIVEMFSVLLLPFSSVLEKLPLPHSLRFRRSKATLDRIIFEMIEDRRRSGVDHGDLLSMLLSTRDEDDGSRMSDDQVRDETMTLFLAGHETTANLLSWTWYLLSEHPEAGEMLRREIDEVLGDRPASLNDVEHLRFTEAVIAESMRLYPPAWAIGRETVAEHELRENRIAPGTTVLMSPAVMHRDARFWDDADEFRPDRWERISVKEAGSRYIYFPFGAGARRCIGESFAWTEGIIVLATLARRWAPKLVAGHPVEAKPLITLRPKYGLRMTLEPRQAH